jgi:hypothetical protein
LRDLDDQLDDTSNTDSAFYISKSAPSLDR